MNMICIAETLVIFTQRQIHQQEVNTSAYLFLDTGRSTRGTCVMSSTSSILRHFPNSAARDTHSRTHRAPEAAIDFALRVQTNLCTI